MTGLIITLAWTMSGIIPMIVYERWLASLDASDHLDPEDTLAGLAISVIAGPIAFIALAAIMGAAMIEEHNDEEIDR